MKNERSKHPPGSPKVAVVDKDADFGLFVSDVAKLGRFQLTHSVETFKAGLRLFPLAPPDIILFDLQFSEGGGFQCMEKLRLVVPHAALIAMTILPNTYSFFRALMAGANGYLEKPFTMEELITSINDVVQGKFALGRAATPHLCRFFKHLRLTTLSSGLTEREEDVLSCVFSGLTDKEIAYTLKIGNATVHTHLHRLFVKLGIHSRKQLILKYSILEPLSTSAEKSLYKVNTIVH